MNPHITQFLTTYTIAYKNKTFRKLTLSKPTDKHADIQKIIITPVMIKNQYMHSFIYMYQRKHVTKNLTLDQAIRELESLIEVSYKHCDLFTETEKTSLKYNKRMESNISVKKEKKAINEKNEKKTISDLSHDKIKTKHITLDNNIYLQELWVVSKNWIIKEKMWDKFKQINKYIEYVDTLIDKTSLLSQETIHILDMWSWKWYLTFAIYDYLTKKTAWSKTNISVTWVERRPDLVLFCHTLAETCGFEWLRFETWDIASYHVKEVDILIALHACDTATDDSILQWIQHDASLIIIAPCCHKQIRHAMIVPETISSITQHGILLERQAELLTDTMRWLILEIHGYKTKIFEFISDWHTHKNVMVVGTKRQTHEISPQHKEKNKKRIEEKKQELTALKELFWVQEFYLENELADKK